MGHHNHPNPFLDRMRANETAFGTFVFSNDTSLTEIIGAAGFDLAVIDTEHAALGVGDLVAHGQAAAAAGISWWARVGRFEPSEVGRILDAGAQGVVFPHYGLNPERLSEFGDSVRYPPEGSRPTCTGTRSATYGIADFSAYVEQANRDVLSVGLIEDASVVDRVEEILADSNIDVIMPGGVGDLASSMGLHGQARHPRVLEAIRRVVKASKDTAHVKVGIYLSDLEAAADFTDLSLDFFIFSIDYKVISSAYRHIRQSLAEKMGEGSHSVE